MVRVLAGCREGKLGAARNVLGAPESEGMNNERVPRRDAPALVVRRLRCAPFGGEQDRLHGPQFRHHPYDAAACTRQLLERLARGTIDEEDHSRCGRTHRRGTEM